MVRGDDQPGGRPEVFSKKGNLHLHLWADDSPTIIVALQTKRPHSGGALRSALNARLRMRVTALGRATDGRGLCASSGGFAARSVTYSVLVRSLCC
jgi:hypothetical protein